MQVLLTTLNAFRLRHGRLCSVVGLVGAALVSAAAGDWTHAAAAVLAAFGLHHVHGLPDAPAPSADPGPDKFPFRCA